MLQLAEPRWLFGQGPAQGLPHAAIHYSPLSLCLYYHTMPWSCLGCERDTWETVVFLSVLKCVVSALHKDSVPSGGVQSVTIVHGGIHFSKKSWGLVPGYGTATWRMWRLRNWAVMWCLSDCRQSCRTKSEAGASHKDQYELLKSTELQPSSADSSIWWRV